MQPCWCFMCTMCALVITRCWLPQGLCSCLSGLLVPVMGGVLDISVVLNRTALKFKTKFPFLSTGRPGS